jgi:hypothetical protein
MIEKPINEDLEFFNDMVNVSVVFMIEESVQTLLFFTIFFVSLACVTLPTDAVY